MGGNTLSHLASNLIALCMNIVYIRMYVCIMYECKYLCVYIYACMYYVCVYMYVFSMCVCMYVCKHECKYVCLTLIICMAETFDYSVILFTYLLLTRSCTGHS